MKKTHGRYTPDGRELMDPKPMQPPLGYKRAPSLAEQIRQQVLAAKLEELDALAETEEEADDFEIDDDMAPFSPHENEGMPTVKELKKRAQEINDEIKRRNIEALREGLEKRQEEMKGRAKRAPSNPSPKVPDDPEQSSTP